MQLSEMSRKKLSTCHPDLQMLVERVAETFPLAVLWGFRGEADQNESYATGKSRLRWPESPHNKTPSMAVDLALIPINWSDLGGFEKLNTKMKEAAELFDIKIVWGGDWNVLRDMDHWQLGGV